jgi:hypothetical protein
MRKHGFESPVSVQMVGEVPRMIDGRGRDVMRLPGGPERIAECLNALRHVHYPANHVAELERQCASKEELRKAAWSEVLELRDRLSAQPERASA